MSRRCRQVWNHLQHFSSSWCFLHSCSWFVRQDYSQTTGGWELLEVKRMRMRWLKSMDFWIWDRYVRSVLCRFFCKGMILPAVALNSDRELLLVLHLYLHGQNLQTPFPEWLTAVLCSLNFFFFFKLTHTIVWEQISQNYSDNEWWSSWWSYWGCIHAYIILDQIYKTNSTFLAVQ